MRYWLMKSEPTVYSLEHLRVKGIDSWEGVRNYQACRFLREEMAVGDLAFFYHSNAKPSGVVGIMRVVKSGYPDDTAWDSSSPYYDPKSTLEKPRWYRVDVAFERALSRLISLDELRALPQLAQSPLVRRGNRLSVLPLSLEEWESIRSLYALKKIN